VFWGGKEKKGGDQRKYLADVYNLSSKISYFFMDPIVFNILVDLIPCFPMLGGEMGGWKS
jgi:hypothetical protein